MAKPEMNQVFRVWSQYPAYKRLQISNLLTNFTTWNSFIALLVLVDKITSSGLQMGTLWSISGLAPLFVGVIIGVWVDRIELKRGMIFVDLMRMGLTLCFIVVPHVNGWTGWILYFFLRFAINVGSSFTFAARQAVIPFIVSKEDLSTANSLNFTLNAVVRLLGATMGGVTVSIFGLNGTFILSAAAFLCSAILILGAHWDSPPQGNRVKKKYWRELKEGFDAARLNPWVKLIMLITFSSGILAGTFSIMIQQYSNDVYHQSGWGVSALYVTEGLVSTLMGLWMANKNFSFKKNSKYGYFYLLYGLSWACFSFTQELWQGILCMVLYAFSLAFSIPFERNTMQLEVPAQVRGRVFNLWNTLTLAMMQFGTFLAGVIMQYLGMVYVPLISGVLEMIVGILFVYYVGIKLERSSTSILWEGETKLDGK